MAAGAALAATAAVAPATRLLLCSLAALCLLAVQGGAVLPRARLGALLGALLGGSLSGAVARAAAAAAAALGLGGCRRALLAVLGCGLLALLRGENRRTVYLATNPLFPPVAVETRLRWIGLTPADFDGITTYDNSRYCKPNPAYYTEILERLGRPPETALMIGNNPSDDMSALKAGLSGYLVTDYLENEYNMDIAPFRRGSFAELTAFAAGL